MSALVERSNAPWMTAFHDAWPMIAGHTLPLCSRDQANKYPVAVMPITNTAADRTGVALDAY